jgi:hypothetical protein
MHDEEGTDWGHALVETHVSLREGEHDWCPCTKARRGHVRGYAPGVLQAFGEDGRGHHCLQEVLGHPLCKTKLMRHHNTMTHTFDYFCWNTKWLPLHHRNNRWTECGYTSGTSRITADLNVVNTVWICPQPFGSAVLSCSMACCTSGKRRLWHTHYAHKRLWHCGACTHMYAWGDSLPPLFEEWHICCTQWYNVSNT